MENKNIVIEDAIRNFTKNRTEEQLAACLTTFRKNLANELIVSVEQADNGLTMKAVTTADGRKWFTVFTSLEEQMKGKDKVQSMFQSSLEKIFLFALENPDVTGVIINPYGNSMSVNREIMKVTLGMKI